MMTRGGGVCELTASEPSTKRFIRMNINIKLYSNAVRALVSGGGGMDEM
jgi:hypothetical protein